MTKCSPPRPPQVRSGRDGADPATVSECSGVFQAVRGEIVTVRRMRSRDHRLDRAKGILIMLVVLGHFLTRASGWDSETLRAVQTTIYSFHMPAFVFLAGITAKSTRLAERTMFFLVLLVTAIPAYYGWMALLDLDVGFDGVTPIWLTWFLMAMVWWMLSVPLIERMPRTMLATSLVVGLIGGIIPSLGDEFAVARTLTFWPFFVVGKLYGARILSWAGERGIAGRTALTGAAIVPVALFVLGDVDRMWLFGSRSIEWFDVGVVDGLGMRAAVAVSAALSTLVLLTWTGRSDDVVATIGRRSLAIYLLHGFAVRLAEEPLHVVSGLLPAPVTLALCLALAAGTTWLFMLSPFDDAVRRYGQGVTRAVLTPRAWLDGLRRPTPAARESAVR